MTLTGLIPAVHSPFHANGDLNLAAVTDQFSVIERQKIRTVFVCGSTGESHSLSVEERQLLTARWSEVLRGTETALVVHVGSNCLPDAMHLAKHAKSVGAKAIAAQAPSYFKPATISCLIECCQKIAAAAPEVPFYFYDIPVMTGVNLSMPEFIEHAVETIPTFAGLKFTNNNLMSYQQCLRAADERCDIAFGYDEMLLPALCLGAKGAVGSSYNFAAPIYHRVISAYEKGDIHAARDEQYRAVVVIQTLAGFGYLPAAKAVMKMLGADVGQPRLPNVALSDAEFVRLQEELESVGFFNWIQD